MKRKWSAMLPRYRVDGNVVDLLVHTRLLLLGVTDAKSYCSVFALRIFGWSIVGACIGAVMGGFSGMLLGVLVGIAMPIVVMHIAVAVPMMLVQVAGYLLGVCWILFCLWVLFKLLMTW